MSHRRSHNYSNAFSKEKLQRRNGFFPSIPSKPIATVKFMDAYEQYGKDFETILSASFSEPF